MWGQGTRAHKTAGSLKAIDACVSSGYAEGSNDSKYANFDIVCIVKRVVSTKLFNIMDLSFVVTCLFLFVGKVPNFFVFFVCRVFVIKCSLSSERIRTYLKLYSFHGHSLTQAKVETGSVTITSKTSWQVGSNVTIECNYINGEGQTLDQINFGIVGETFITVYGTGLVVEKTPWPDKWTWYQGRVSWVGDLVSKKAAFRLTKAALNDSRIFYCQVQWLGSFESKRAETSILITGL